MSNSIAWDNEDQTVVLQAYSDPVTKDDLYDLVKKSAQVLSSVSHTVHLIIDERRVNFVLNSADHSYMERMLPANQGAVIVVVLAGNMAYKRIAQQRITQTISKSAPHFVETVEEARAILQQEYGVDYTSQRVS